MTRLGIFVSGSGTNCENIARYFAGSPDVAVAMVLSNREDAYALVRARNLGIPVEVVARRDFNDPDALLPVLRKHGVDFIVLAGFLLVVPDFLIEAFPDKIINIHPALLPKFGGMGMYGHHIHEAVKAACETETGMTVHYVSPTVDGGRIIAQFSTVLSPEDTADDIAAKEHMLEMEHFPQVIDDLLHGRINPATPADKNK